MTLPTALHHLNPSEIHTPFKPSTIFTTSSSTLGIVSVPSCLSPAFFEGPDSFWLAPPFCHYPWWCQAIVHYSESLAFPHLLLHHHLHHISVQRLFIWRFVSIQSPGDPVALKTEKHLSSSFDFILVSVWHLNPDLLPFKDSVCNSSKSPTR